MHFEQIEGKNSTAENHFIPLIGPEDRCITLFRNVGHFTSQHGLTFSNSIAVRTSNVSRAGSEMQSFASPDVTTNRLLMISVVSLLSLAMDLVEIA
jgi:hypothetical protein